MPFDRFLYSKQSFHNWDEKCQCFAATGDSLVVSMPWPESSGKEHTSTTTSLWAMNSGIVEACTGVMRLKPMLDTASKIHSAREGVKPSHARDDGDTVVLTGECERMGAMMMMMMMMMHWSVEHLFYYFL